MTVAIRQITKTSPDWTGNEYPSTSPVSPDKKFIVLVKRDHYGLYSYASGSFIRDLPVQASGEIKWWTATKLIYIQLNKLLVLDVITMKSEVLKVFSEYPEKDADDHNGITGGGESDISEDRDHIVLSDITKTDIFIFTLSTLTKGPVFKNQNGYDGLKLLPDNSVILSRNPVDGVPDQQGLWLLRPGSRGVRIAPSNGHADTGRDANGDQIVIWHNSASNPVEPIGCDNGIVKINIDKDTKTCLFKLPWSLAVDICLVDKKFVLVSTYKPFVTDKPTSWDNKVLKVGLDASGAEILTDHYSQPPTVGETYNWQPKAFTDGDILLLSSNNGVTNIANYCDVWMGKMAAELPDVHPPTPDESPALSLLKSQLDTTRQELDRTRKERDVANQQVSSLTNTLNMVKSELTDLQNQIQSTKPSIPEPDKWKKVDLMPLVGVKWGFQANGTGNLSMFDVAAPGEWNIIRRADGNEYKFVARNGEFEMYERIGNK